MAGLITRSSFQAAKKQTFYFPGVAIQACHSSDGPRVIKNATTAGLKRGTGGRSSFNGIVCTVFGNTGFLGSYVCNGLGKIGTQLILPYRGDHYNSMPLKLVGDLGQVLFHPFDIRDEESILRCVKYSNVVVNLVGRDWETKNFSYADVNVTGARTLARVCKEAGVERFIHLSCLNASPNPQPLLIKGGSRFLKSKWEGELAVKEEFPGATIIRPSDVYGQEDAFLRAYWHRLRRHFRSVPLYKKGEVTEKQPVWVGDVAAGIIAVLKDPNTVGKTYQFVGPKRYKLCDLVDWFNKLLRRNLEEYGYARVNLEYAYLYHVKIALVNALSPAYPVGNCHWEAFEKENTTDKVLSNLPTLEDLGIAPMEMENQIPWELRAFRFDAYYQESLGEFDPPPLPKPISTSLAH